MPPAERAQAVAAAQRQDRSQGEWLAMAIRTQLQWEAGALAPVRDGVVAPVPLRVALDDLEALGRFCAAVAEAAGKPLPRDIQRVMWRQVRERLGMEPGALRGVVVPKVAPVAPSIEIPAPRPPDGDHADQQHGGGEQ